MPVATALVTGNEPLPRLAEQAVAEALSKAGLAQARGVLLYLSEHFRRDPQPSLVACAKAGRCLQVAGAVAEGLFTESGWTLDRPAAAALVLGGTLGLGPAIEASQPLLSFGPANGISGSSLRQARYGFLQSRTSHWQQGRLSSLPLSEVVVLGAKPHLCLASGWHPLSPVLPVTACQGLELLSVADQNAQDSLRRYLPADCRNLNPLPLHQMAALLLDDQAEPGEAISRGRYTPLPLLAAHALGPLTLGNRLVPGAQLVWAIRRPFLAEGDIRDSLRQLHQAHPRPLFGLMSSCVSRGASFYGTEDRDLIAWQETFPEIPLLGAYGCAQLWPTPGGTRSLHHAAVTALFDQENTDV